MGSEREDTSALVAALSTDLRAQLGSGAPIVVYAWSRGVRAVNGPRVVMFAKLFQHHHSDIIAVDGVDADHAYRRLVEQCRAWVKPPDAPG